MTPPSSVPDARVREVIEARYALGSLCASRPIPQGSVNSSTIVETARGGARERFVLREYKAGTRAEQLAFEHGLINFLAGRGLSIVGRVREGLDGRTVVEHGGACFALFEFLDGEAKYRWDDSDCDPRELDSAAATLATYHGLIADWQPIPARRSPDALTALPQLGAQIEAARPGADARAFAKLLDAARVDIDVVIQRAGATLEARGAAQLPRLAVHGDYHLENLLFQSGAASGLVDFDWSRVDLRIFDLGFALVYCCTQWGGARDGELRLDAVARFLRAYTQQARETEGFGPLSQAELDCLPTMTEAANIYLLHWIVTDLCETNGDPVPYTRWLRHSLGTSSALTRAQDFRRVISQCSAP